MSPTPKKPKVAIWKFASCDGCQLTLLDCEDELLAVAGAVEFAYFLEATSTVSGGPYDVSVVEGSVTNEHDAERIHGIREHSTRLVTIGACATSGGIQALKNFADVEEFTRIVYAHPEYISSLATSTPISDHVKVDYELRGCPISKAQLLQAISQFLLGGAPQLESAAVCLECKRRGTTCLTVASGVPCLGPVTHAGCGALCPSFDRGCFGCFGPSDTTNVPALADRLRELNVSDGGIYRLLHTFAAAAPEFRDFALTEEGKP